MKLGIRFRSVFNRRIKPQNIISTMGHDHSLVELFDVDTGEVLENVIDVDVKFPVDGVVTAIVKFYPAEMQGLEQADV